MGGTPRPAGRAVRAAALGAALLAWAAAGVAAPGGIGPRDLLQVTVYQEPDLTQEVRVADDGTVTLPLVGVVRAAGLTPERLEKELVRLYREYLHSPQITVFVKEYFTREISVSMLGEVARPGLYKFPEGVTLLEAISQVGGLTPDGGERIVVMRPVRSGESRDADALLVNAQELFTPIGMKTQNVPLQEGDTVHVPRADHYFVFGEVTRPGSYKLEKGTTLTVLKAISLAGGFTDKASKRGIRITREEGDRKAVFKADLDTEVRAQDIVIVPESFF